MKKENIGSEDPQSLDNRRLSVIARNPNHPMHTHAKAELERRRMKTSEGAMKRIATTQASKTDRMASTDKKGLETFKKKPVEEKTLTPAELKKREKIAKAIEKDNPDMPMDKKMAIATATAKRVAEGKVNEISVGKLIRYSKAAVKDTETKRDVVRKAMSSNARQSDFEKAQKAVKGLSKRGRGSDMYVDKMTGRSKVKPTPEATIKELDKKTLGSYIKKAGPDREKQKAQAARHSDAGDMADKDKDMYKHYGKAQRSMDKAANRSKYIGKAVDKLTKEATIPDGQTAMTRVAKVSDADREKLIKIRKMLDKEKKK